MHIINSLNNDFSSSDSNYEIEILITILVMFLCGCVIGYCLEVLFRRFITAKKWVNPGFMKGPWLPLYGFGLLIMFFLSTLIIKYMPNNLKFYNPLGNLWNLNYKSGPTWADLIPILLMGLAMNLLEFVAGLIFVKGFKVRLWDYTNMKGNIMGIICPLFSLIWFIVAIVYYYALNPFVYLSFRNTYSYIFGVDSTSSNVVHVGIIFVLGVVYGVMLIDFISSIQLFSKISKFANDKGIIAKYEKIKEEQNLQKKMYRERIFDSLPSIFNKKDDSKLEERKEKIEEKVKKAVLIDPNKKNSSNNYDENGRPIKEDEKID